MFVVGGSVDLKGLQSNYHYYDFDSVDGKEMIYDIVSRDGLCVFILVVTSNDTIYNNIKRHLKVGLNESQCCDIENFVLFMLDLYSTMVKTRCFVELQFVHNEVFRTTYQNYIHILQDLRLLRPLDDQQLLLFQQLTKDFYSSIQVGV